MGSVVKVPCKCRTSVVQVSCKSRARVVQRVVQECCGRATCTALHRHCMATCCECIHFLEEKGAACAGYVAPQHARGHLSLARHLMRFSPPPFSGAKPPPSYPTPTLTPSD